MPVVIANKEPRMVHTPPCSHLTYQGRPLPTRNATKLEQRHLPHCPDCVR
jgi:hypothetical protein